MQERGKTMTNRRILMGILFLVLSTVVAVQAEKTRDGVHYVLRPNLTDSGFCNVRVPIWGDYTATRREIVEIDWTCPADTACGPDSISVTSNNWKVVKPIRPHMQILVTGDPDVDATGVFFRAIRKGRATITVTLTNFTQPPTVASFQYHIIVQ